MLILHYQLTVIQAEAKNLFYKITHYFNQKPYL